MNNEETKQTVMLFLNEYHNSLFSIPLKENQLNEIYTNICQSLIKKLTTNEN
jgi:hypothetical protein